MLRHMLLLMLRHRLLILRHRLLILRAICVVNIMEHMNRLWEGMSSCEVQVRAEFLRDLRLR